MAYLHACEKCKPYEESEFHSIYYGYGIEKGATGHWHAGAIESDTLADLKAQIRNQEGIR